MNTTVLSVGAAVTAKEAFGRSYTASVTEDGSSVPGDSSVLGESVSLITAAPESLGSLSA
ncbi:hypothetical protein D3C76_1452280 [compost metagenome]